MRILLFIPLLATLSIGFAQSLAAPPVPADNQRPGDNEQATPSSSAYAALEHGDLAAAVAGFREAVNSDLNDAALRKDFAYALLKTGDTEAARDQFGEVTRLAPDDSYAALEYAFLCHETGKQSEAWSLFRRLRDARSAEHRETARRTFASLEQELIGRIERLASAVAQNRADESSHVELARAYFVRNEFALAAKHFEIAFQLKPEISELLLELAGAAEKAGDAEKYRASILLASRAPSAFVAEQALSLLPQRYPYLYEFENALALHPGNSKLRREMAFFLLSLGRKEAAVGAFRQVLLDNPEDLLASAQLGFLLLESGERHEANPLLRAALASEDLALRERVRAALGEPSEGSAAASASDPMQHGTPTQPAASVPEMSLAENADVHARATEAREMGRKSYDAGFLPDAIRYYRQAHDLDPTSFDTMLRLAIALNTAHRDPEAIQWYFLAARSPDEAIAAEATQALRNLTAPAPSVAAQAQRTPPANGVVASFWAMPMHSTRWGSTFAYSQARAELEQPKWPVVPYLSLRFVGDTTGAVGQANPQFLSENAFILSTGFRTRPRNGFLVWAEAGSAMSYLGSQRNQTESFVPDYRGGISHFKLAGPSLLAKTPGWFAETMNDLVYIHRFDRDTLAVSRNRLGRHLGSRDALGGLQLQLFLNVNANADFKRQAWANFLEAGPGVRVRWNCMPSSVSFTFSTLRGHHPIARIDGRANTYTDFQAGLWYAHTR